ncbi:MAG: DUF2621 family protein, partial [Candidatus Omnitrophica bacterium]|nr:DUF2621 family protein [Candidatus Omnitrophota bacterium]
MSEQSFQDKISWDEVTEQHFQKILLEIPDLIRGIAELRVSKKAENIVRDEERNVIVEKDMVDAFFAETPGGFIPAMKKSMEELNIDYTKYG